MSRRWTRVGRGTLQASVSADLSGSDHVPGSPPATAGPAAGPLKPGRLSTK